ncbi:sugar phosphate nucleotidyltransferase [Halalkalibacter akibai]|uniref:Mannose-1-phosphate guanylyltransferase n=1 Tax=Halalkalibacter akibai (strain ATCC 43226 / DSM 21942 / CIP 109018 / JCM 9157 / 1139) TaxID=1236973 RepID=W4QNJ1_HALA3|nr:sugar phosphate nucleotidyltransferase [Halalkalibacter akibai]GAE33452.1 mannose-1-phosphate guanylyltransferase [Halalkalibacter akibai JCM 9157]
MKGVIMAGGKGTRLRPLTCNVPKPMVPLIEKPVMQYSIELLKKYGITEIAVTVQYLPDVIKDYFGDGSKLGVQLTYFEETTPLGTAGSVKQAEAFLDEPFIVVSGDALTDFDLQRGIDFHEKNNSLTTIFMKQVECPLEFGVIMTDEQDRIVRFLEKPSWSEVFSDTVNTGIYIMDPSIFSYIPEDSVCDFSKDVFPRLLEEEAPLFGYAADGYWSDIGNLKQYREAHSDILNGDVSVDIIGREIEPNIWVGENVTFETGVKLEGPVAIGSNSIIRSGAQIGPHTIIGSGSTISNQASLKRTVIWNEAYIGQNSELRGVTLCHGVTVGAKTSLYEDVVVGHQTVVGEGAVIQPEAKIWPYKRIEAYSTVEKAFVWNEIGVRSLLKGHRATGIANIELTPENGSKLGAAYGSALNQGDRVMVASDGQPFSNLLKMSLIQSLQSVGINVVELGQTMLPILRYSVENEAVQGGIYIRLSGRNEEKQLMIEFFDELGLPIDTSLQRELEQIITFHTYRRVAFNHIGELEYNQQFEEKYEDHLLRSIHLPALQERKLKIALHDEATSKLQFLSRLLSKLGCEIAEVPKGIDVDSMRNYLLNHAVDLAIIVGESGEFVSLMTANGEFITEEEQLTMFILLQLEKGTRPSLAIPLYGGSALEALAASYNKKLVRTKTSARSMMESEGTVQMMYYDAPYAIGHLLDYLVIQNLSLGELLTRLPIQAIYKEEVNCKTEQKGLVMRKLMESLKGKEVELIDGMKVHQEGSWTFIVPDQEEERFTVYAQAKDQGHAKQLAGEYIEQINVIKQQSS